MVKKKVKQNVKLLNNDTSNRKNSANYFILSL